MRAGADLLARPSPWTALKYSAAMFDGTERPEKALATTLSQSAAFFSKIFFWRLTMAPRTWKHSASSTLKCELKAIERSVLETSFSTNASNPSSLPIHSSQRPSSSWKHSLTVFFASFFFVSATERKGKEKK